MPIDFSELPCITTIIVVSFASTFASLSIMVVFTSWCYLLDPQPFNIPFTITTATASYSYYWYLIVYLGDHIRYLL